jgi:DNA-binding CsgD family transcriptional regulator/PAS domain-containing protein
MKSPKISGSDGDKLLIDSIYDAALNYELWPKVAQNLAQTVAADQVILRQFVRPDIQVLQTFSYNRSDEFNQVYDDYYVHIDPWVKEYVLPGKTVFKCSQQHQPDRELEKSEMYCDFLAPQNVYYALYGYIQVDPQNSYSLTMQRSKKHHAFDEVYLDQIQRLAPHLVRAMLISQKTASVSFENHLLKDALDQINSPLLLVDRNGVILFINKMAEKLIVNRNDLSIRKNSISLLDPDAQAELRSLIFHACDFRTGGIGGGMQVGSGFGASNLKLLVSPINPVVVNNGGAGDSYALIVLSDDSANAEFSVELLQQLYGFTAAQAKLARALCRGMSIADYAEKYSLSRNTLKTQLRACYHKTSTKRLHQMIRLISSGPPGKIG